MLNLKHHLILDVQDHLTKEKAALQVVVIKQVGVISVILENVVHMALDLEQYLDAMANLLHRVLYLFA